MARKKAIAAAIILLGLVLMGLCGLSNLAIYPWSQEIHVVEAGSTIHPYTWEVLDGGDKSTEIGYFFIDNRQYNTESVQTAIREIGGKDSGYQFCPMGFCSSIWDVTQTDVAGFGFSIHLKTLRDASVASNYGSDSYRWHDDIRETMRDLVWGNRRFDVIVPKTFPDEIGWLVYYRCDMEYRHGTLPEERIACDIYQEKIRIYDCSQCGGICLLDYLSDDSKKLEFLNRFGQGEVCKLKSNTEYKKICETGGDCRGVSINYDLGRIDKAELWFDEVARCEKANPSDPAIAFVNKHTAGRFGTCEKGAKTVDDCIAVLGSHTRYNARTVDGGYFQGFSGWGVKDGICYLGECEGYWSCYDLYNSIHYECVPRRLDDSSKNFIGVCQYKLSTGEIAEKCDKMADEGIISPLKSGYSWIIENGECVQSKEQVENECSKPEDCKCSVGEVASCQKVMQGGREIGICDCSSEPSPKPTPTTTVAPTTTIKWVPDIDVGGGALVWYVIAGVMLLVGVGLLFQ